MIVVLIGVSGAGKTTIGKLLAARLGTMFSDADDFHSQANREKMAAGHALDDADRQPWLEALHGLLHGWWKQGSGGVLACSALKESYRQTLSHGMPPSVIQFVLLQASREAITERLAHRHHAFMNPALLDSQIATLELPADALAVVNDKAPDAVVEHIVRQLESAKV